MTAFRFSDCTYSFMLDYIQYLSTEKGYSPGSVNHRIAAVKSYLRYAADCDVTLQQIWLSISRIPLQTVSKEVLPIIDADALKALIAAPGNRGKGIRDRMILTLLFDAALRANELISLKVKDIDVHSDEPCVLIHGKGDKERIVGITENAYRIY